VENAEQRNEEPSPPDMMPHLPADLWPVVYSHHWTLHDEHIQNSREQERLRTTTTQITLTLGTLLVGLNSTDVAQADPVITSYFIMSLGLFGSLVALRHHERSRFFMRAADFQREAAREVLRSRGYTSDTWDLFEKAKEEHSLDPLGTNYQSIGPKPHLSSLVRGTRDAMARDPDAKPVTADSPVEGRGSGSDACSKSPETGSKEESAIHKLVRGVSRFLGSVIGHFEIWLLWCLMNLALVLVGWMMLKGSPG